MSVFRRRLLGLGEAPLEPIAVIENRIIGFSSTSEATVEAGYRSGYNVIRFPCKPSTPYVIHFLIKPLSISRIGYSEEKFDGTQSIPLHGFVNNSTNQFRGIVTNSTAKYIYVAFENTVMTADDIIIQNRKLLYYLASWDCITTDRVNISNILPGEIGYKISLEFDLEVVADANDTDSNIGYQVATSNTWAFSLHPLWSYTHRKNDPAFSINTHISVELSTERESTNMRMQHASTTKATTFLVTNLCIYEA